MIFDDAFSLLKIGTKIRVSDGTPEQQNNHWRSHNFAGTLIEKIDGPPRALHIELPERVTDEGYKITNAYTVLEGGAHLFEEVKPKTINKAAQRRARYHRMKPHELMIEIDTRLVKALKALLPDVTIAPSFIEEHFPNAKIEE